MRKIALLLISSFLYSSSFYAQKVQNRDSDPFDQITVFGKVEVYLKKGPKPTIKLESQDVDLDNITTRTDGNELKISLSEQILSGSKKAKIIITYDKVKRISANAGCEINTDDTIKSIKMELESYSGSSLYAFIKCDTIKIDVSSGALVSLEGSAKSLEVEVGSGSTFSGYDFKSEQAIVKSNSRGIAKIKVTDMLDASATTGGKISYDGEPKQKKVKAIMGGKVTKLDE